MRNYNTLIDRYPGADGMKTGFICASGFNLVASATRNDKRLIAVVLGAPSSAGARRQGRALLERGFNSNRPVLADALAGHRRKTDSRSTPHRRICAKRCAASTASVPPPRRRTRRAGERRSPIRPTQIFLSSLLRPSPRARRPDAGVTGRAGPGLYRHQAAGAGFAGRGRAKKKAVAASRRPARTRQGYAKDAAAKNGTATAAARRDATARSRSRTAEGPRRPSRHDQGRRFHRNRRRPAKPKPKPRAEAPQRRRAPRPQTVGEAQRRSQDQSRRRSPRHG